MDSEHKEVKEALLRMRQKVLQDVKKAYETSNELGQDGVPDLGDLSSQAYDREMLHNVSTTQRKTLRDIDAALKRIDEGEYGICMRCEEDIPPRRLEVRPFSRYCVECKSEVEKSGE